MIVVFGATGTLGGDVVARLRARGEQVRAVVRERSEGRASGRHTSLERLEDLGAEVAFADLTRAETLGPALAGATTVVSTASATKRPPPDTLESVDAAGTGALARAAATAGVAQLVYVSAAGADPAASAPIMRAKGLAEAAIRDAGVPATIVRPAKYMQDWIGFVLLAQLQSGRNEIQLIGPGDTPTVFVDESDVAEVVSKIAGDAGTVGNTIDLAAEAATYQNLVARISARLGGVVRAVTLPPGSTVDTVPPEVAPVLTGLLTFQAQSPAIESVTPEVAERFGLAYTSIDDFLAAALGS
ncbi:MAG: NmrA family NAD(P)-binding protein [Trueperaceae bacterium]